MTNETVFQSVRRMMTKIATPEDRRAEKEKTELHLGENMYSICFAAYIKRNIEEFEVSGRLQGRAVFAALWIYAMELTLIAIILKIVVFQDGFAIQTPNVDVFMTRFLACFLMHLKLLDEVHEGLVMLKYLGCHPEEFANRTMPFLCAFMKSSGALLAEGINMLMLATRKDVPMCITFFVAFHVLADIDKIYLESVSNLRLLEAIEHPIPWKTKMRDINFEEVSLSMKFVLLAYYV